MCFHGCNSSHEHYLEFWRLWYDSVCACLFPRVHAEAKGGSWVPPPPLRSTFTALRQSFTEPLQLGWLAGKCLGSACIHPHPCWGYRGMPSHAQLPPWVLGIQTLSQDCSSVFVSLALKKCILKSVKVSRDQKV